MAKVEWFGISDEDVRRKESALSTMLDQFDVPAMRKDAGNTRNLRWLNRNLSINNGDHPLHDTAMGLLKWLLRWHEIGKVTVGDR